MVPPPGLESAGDSLWVRTGLATSFRKLKGLVYRIPSQIASMFVALPIDHTRPAVRRVSSWWGYIVLRVFVCAACVVSTLCKIVAEIADLLNWVFTLMCYFWGHCGNVRAEFYEPTMPVANLPGHDDSNTASARLRQFRQVAVQSWECPEGERRRPSFLPELAPSSSPQADLLPAAVAPSFPATYYNRSVYSHARSPRTSPRISVEELPPDRFSDAASFYTPTRDSTIAPSSLPAEVRVPSQASYIDLGLPTVRSTSSIPRRSNRLARS